MPQTYGGAANDQAPVRLARRNLRLRNRNENTLNDVTARAIDIIASYSNLDAAQITRDTELDLIGINSLELTEVVMDLEDHYGVQIDLNASEAWDSLKTVGDVVETIEKLVDSGS